MFFDNFSAYFTFNFDVVLLNEVCSTKFLGLIVDSELTSADNVVNLYHKITSEVVYAL